MKAVKILAVLFIVAGIMGLVYGRFSFTDKTHEATVGPVEISIQEKQTVYVPVWAGVTSS